MSPPSTWTRLVSDAINRRMSQWRLGEIAQAVREADGAWTTQVRVLQSALSSAERQVDSLLTERDALAERLAVAEAERDAYRARAAALEGAIRLALPAVACWADPLLNEAAETLAAAMEVTK